MIRIFIVFFSLIGFNSITLSQVYPNNEDGDFEDILTPEYYNTPNGGNFRIEVNKLVHFARQMPFQHPLQDPTGTIPDFTIHKNFGDGIGPGGTSQHHPATDIYVGAGQTNVDLHAAHDGYVSTHNEVAKYRNHLSIITEIKDSANITIGKIHTIYAHIDLSLDSLDNILMDGQYVNRGDLVSKHLYSGTVGGPHLHFEIRYYRIADDGIEEFYGIVGGPNPNPNLSEPSAGSWIYGYWDPNTGYGFGNPENHLNDTNTSIDESERRQNIRTFPNPSNGVFCLSFANYNDLMSVTVFNALGQLVYSENLNAVKQSKMDLSVLEKGIYFLKIHSDKGNAIYAKKIIIE